MRSRIVVTETFSLCDKSYPYGNGTDVNCHDTRLRPPRQRLRSSRLAVTNAMPILSVLTYAPARPKVKGGPVPHESGMRIRLGFNAHRCQNTLRIEECRCSRVTGRMETSRSSLPVPEKTRSFCLTNSTMLTWQNSDTFGTFVLWTVLHSGWLNPARPVQCHG
jgi:hypothetical protein